MSGAPLHAGCEQDCLPKRKQRVLVFIVAYNAERTIATVLTRIPETLFETYDVEVLVIDDCSRDETFLRGHEVQAKNQLPCAVRVLFNPVNQGYGGNQKIGFHYAIEEKFDFVALVHGDGQYAPECLPQLLAPLASGECDAVFGSRMMTKGAALKGGMPFYKYVGNKLLTRIQNRLLRTHLSEFHSGYRVYSTQALRRVPFSLNTNDFHFDTEIIIQLVIAGMRIREVSIPTYYGDEICHVDGLRYAWHVVLTTLQARVQELGIFYDRKFDCGPPVQGSNRHALKLGYASPHTFVLDSVEPGTRVLLLGCDGGQLGQELRKRGRTVTGLDAQPLGPGVELDHFIRHDLNARPLPVDLADYDVVLALDVVEHLASPEAFAEGLYETAKFASGTRLIVSTGNVASIWTRIGLILGQFNYSKRGILDITHTRLFTFTTLCRLFEQAGFETLRVRGIPAPFPLVFQHGWLPRVLLKANEWLIAIRRSLFSYQVLVVLRPRPSLPYLLLRAHEGAQRKIREESSPKGSSVSEASLGLARTTVER